MGWAGESVAGKLVLWESLGVVLGGGGRAELVRQGAEQGEVLAEFDLPEGHPARAVLQEAGLPVDDTLLMRRVNSRDGRKTAWVNDRRCSGEVLRALSECLVELHGQHDDRGLLDPKGHRDLLDDYAGLSPARERVRRAWQARAGARKTLAAAEAKLAEMRAEEEFLRHAVAELDALSPEPGEEAELDAKRRLMQQGERIAEDIARARDALRDGAEGQAQNALRWLDGAAGQAEGQLEGALAALGRALVELDEAATGVETCLEALRFDPLELEATEERLFAIRALARKHGVMADDLAGFAEQVRGQIAQLDAGADDLMALQAAVKEADAAYEAEAEALSAARAKAAGKLDKAVMAELAPLKMEGAVVTPQPAAL